MSVEHIIRCDITGCNALVNANGGGLVFQTASAQKTVHLCQKHWDEVARTLLPLFGVMDDSSEDMADNNRGDKSGTRSPSGKEDNVLEFPRQGPEEVPSS